MMNFSSVRRMEPRQRNFFVVCIIFLFAVFFGLMWYIAHETNLMDIGGLLGNTISKRANRVTSPEDRVRLIANETKSLVGTIDQVTTLKADNTKFLQVRAFVIDRDKISTVDFSTPSQALPTTEETFTVTLNDKTLLKSGGGTDSIQPGDFVSIVTAENIFDAKRLTAVSIEKLSGVPSAHSEQKNK